MELYDHDVQKLLLSFDRDAPWISCPLLEGIRSSFTRKKKEEWHYSSIISCVTEKINVNASWHEQKIRSLGQDFR